MAKIFYSYLCTVNHERQHNLNINHLKLQKHYGKDFLFTETKQGTGF